MERVERFCRVSTVVESETVILELNSPALEQEQRRS
jgi:hypothetical protein